VKAEVIYFNATSLCATVGQCSFAENSTWIGEIVPGYGDSVVIDGNKAVTITLDPTTPQAGVVYLQALNLFNSAFLWVERISFSATNLTWDSLSTVTIVSSNGSFALMQGSSMQVIGSTVTTRELDVNFTSLLDSTLTSSYIITKPSFNISNSNLYVTIIFSLYATGNVKFSSTLTIFQSAEFVKVPNLQVNYISASSGVSLRIVDSPSFISTIYLHNGCTVTYTSSTPSSHWLGYTYTALYSSASLSLGENVNLTLGHGGSQMLGLSMEDYSILNVINADQRTSFAPVEISHLAAIYNAGNLDFYTGEIPASIYVAEEGSLLVYNNVENTFSLQGECGVEGPGLLLVYGNLTCKGTLSIGSLQIMGGNVEVGILSTTDLTGYGFIAGDVIVQGSLVRNALTLTVEGEYIQTGGTMNFTTHDPDYPSLQVEGLVSITNVSLYLQVYSLFDDKYARQAIFKSQSYHGNFARIQDDLDISRELVITRFEEIVYVEVYQGNYFQRNWQWLVVITGMALIVLLFEIALHKNESSFERMENNDPHITVTEYFAAIRFKNASCCMWAVMIPIGILILPLFVEAAILTGALAFLIPLGFFIGLIEHRFVFLWALIVLFIQLGGLLDLFADISLVAKFFIYYFDTTFEIDNSNDRQLDNAENFVYIRLALTLGGSLCSLIFLYFLQGALGGLLDKLSGKKFWEANKKSSSSPFSSAGLIFAILICVMLWKLVLMAFRLQMLYSVAKSLITKRHLEQRIQWKVQWLEIILFFDLVWSGIPLGVLTALELFVYEHELIMNGDTLFELLKMGALAVDVVGASFLVYFVLCGLNHKFSCLRHHKLHEHHHLAHTTISVNQNQFAVDTTPLLQSVV
jgi:hypothetical protein